MIEDKERWNKRFVEFPMPSRVSKVVEKYYKEAELGEAIDIACGTGRNTHFLVEQGFKVDAVDLSDYALGKLKDSENINKIEVDLDEYNLEIDRYNLIVNINFLNRRLISQMVNSLKKGGLIIFETFIVAHDDEKKGSMNPNYLLQSNELLESFKELNIIYYEEKKDVNLRGENIKIASFVGKKL